jgi:hypothetical protein
VFGFGSVFFFLREYIMGLAAGTLFKGKNYIASIIGPTRSGGRETEGSKRHRNQQSVFSSNEAQEKSPFPSHPTERTRVQGGTRAPKSSSSTWTGR